MINKSKIFYSPRIKEIIDFMSVYYNEHQCFPKLDEIGKALNLTKQRVGILLKNAERLGLIKSDNVFMRKYMLTKSTKNSKLKVNNYYEFTATLEEEFDSVEKAAGQINATDNAIVKEITHKNLVHSLIKKEEDDDRK